MLTFLCIWFSLLLCGVPLRAETISLSDMTLEEKIGQLFMVAAVSDADSMDEDALNKTFMERSPYCMAPDYVADLIERYHVGGVIFLGAGTLRSTKQMAAYFQSLSDIPLLVGLDAEWGTAMRLKDGLCFAKNGQLGSMSDEVVFAVARAIGQECTSIGVHINFAPVVDINTNPMNPIIGSRSFGADKACVAKKGIAFMRGLAAVGVTACAKHFPGHGDTTVDSHIALPTLKHDVQRLRDIELWPFVELIKAGVPMIMTGHLAVPALDPSGTPATLSRIMVHDMLRVELCFDGLIVTDGLGMQAITDSADPGQAALQALLAGNDILLCPVDVPAAFACVKQALSDGRLSLEELDGHVERILRLKNRLF